MTYFCCCGGTPPPPPPIGACCYVVNGVMVCENNISCNDCARKSQYYYCYPGKTCAQVTCPDPPTTTSSTTTTACPCPFSNCGTDCGPFRFCPAGQYFDCAACVCVPGTTTTPCPCNFIECCDTATRYSDCGLLNPDCKLNCDTCECEGDCDPPSTTTTTSTSTTTTLCPCPVANCGCPYGPTINCGDGEVFDCDVCECVEGITTTSTTTTSSTTTTTSDPTTTTTTTTTTTEAPTTTTTSEPDPQKCCCYHNSQYVDCHDLPAGQSCDQFSVGTIQCKQYDGLCSGNDCPQVILTSTTTTTIGPDGPKGCIKCDEPQPCPSPPYEEGAESISRICTSPSDGTCPPGYDPINVSCATILLAPCQTCEGFGEFGCKGGCTYECKGAPDGLPSIPMWQLVSDTCEEGDMTGSVCLDCSCPDSPCGPAGGRLTQCDQSQIGQTRGDGCCGFCF